MIQSYHNAPPTLRLDILLLKDGEIWTAHCLQLDLVSTGPTADAAFDDAREACAAHVLFALQTDNVENLFRPADPSLVRRMFHAKQQGILRLEWDRQEASLEIQRLLASAA